MTKRVRKAENTLKHGMYFPEALNKEYFMKKIIKGLGIAAFIGLSLFGFAISLTGCPEPIDTAQDVKLTGITLNIYSVKKSYNQGDTLDLSGLVVTASYSNNTSKAVTNWTASPANGAVLSTTGTTTVTVSYTESDVAKSETFAVTVADPDNPLPTKTLSSISAIYNETHHPVIINTPINNLKNGLTVTATYSDTSTDEVSDYTLSGDLTSTGEKTITVSYTEGSITEETTFKVTVQPAPEHGISLSSVSFTAATYGYSPVTAKTVTVNNVGTQATGDLTVALSGANNGSFTLSKTSINSIAVGEDDTFTVKPNDNLAVGTYTATITITR